MTMNFNKWTVRTKLCVLSAILILNMLCVGFFSWTNSLTLVNHIVDLSRTQMPMVKHVLAIDGFQERLRGDLLHIILLTNTGNDDKLASVHAETTELAKKMNQDLENLELLLTNQDTKKSVEIAKVNVAAFTKAATDIAAIALTGAKVEAFQNLPQFMESFETVEKDLNVIEELIEAESAKSAQKGEDSGRSSNKLNLVLMVVGAIFGLMISGWIIWDLIRAFTGVMRNLTDQSSALDHAVSSISNVAQQLSESTTQQAAAIEETVSSMEEMTSMLGQTTQTTEKSLGVAERGQHEATTGKEVISKMSNAMIEIQASNEKLESLIQLIDQIQNKTKVINDIVFETRLLSFNASIEAARAGAHGKGFAVVAEEVGKLASMSGRAADEIRDLLDSSTREVTQVVKSTQERVSVGKEVSQECQDAFNSMGGTLENITQSMKMIAGATQEQETGVKQTNRAMTEMDQVTQRNARNAESLAHQASALSDTTAGVKSAVERIRTVIFGGAANTFGHSATFKSEDPSRAGKKPENVTDIRDRRRGDRRRKIAQMISAASPVAEPVTLASTGTDSVKPATTTVSASDNGISRSDSRWKVL